MALPDPLNLFKLAQSLAGSARRGVQRLRADHRTINAGAVRFSPVAMVRHYLYVKVSPSRSAARGADDLAVPRAQAFSERAFPGVFPSTADLAGPDQVCFAVWDERHVTHERALYIHRSGLVELLWALQLEPGADGQPLLSATGLVSPVLQLAAAVGSEEYADLSRAGRGRRRFAKVDWRLNTTMHASSQEGEVGWDAVAFPAAAPPRAAHSRPFSPPGGYGGDSLKSVSRHHPPAEVAAVFLRELLLHNGYHSLGTAVDDVVQTTEHAVAHTRQEVTTTSPPAK